MSKPLTAQEKAKAKEIFDNLDQDGDGKLDKGDLKGALTEAGFQVTDDDVDVSCSSIVHRSRTKISPKGDE